MLPREVAIIKVEADARRDKSLLGYKEAVIKYQD